MPSMAVLYVICALRIVVRRAGTCILAYRESGCSWFRCIHDRDSGRAMAAMPLRVRQRCQHRHESLHGAEEGWRLESTVLEAPDDGPESNR